MLSAQKHARAKLTTEQKAECRQKYTKLMDAINTARDSYQEEARSIAQDHGRRLSEPEKKKLRLGIDDLRAMRVNIVRSNPKALLKDVNSTFNTMEKEWTAINARTSMEGFYIAVRGDLEHYHEAKLFLTAKAKSFIKDVLHFEPKLLALKSESWVVGNFGAESSMSTTQRLPLSKLVSLCRQNIQDGLDNILQKNKLASKKIPMNYDNYEKRIVKVYAIAIDGWTYEKSVCNPGKIGRREHLIKLLDALVTGTCSWVTLNDDEVSECISNNRKRQASGKQVYKPCKAAQ
ncbi:uncharacterized protein EDB91DRAFT_1243592 [Suillus paluster]|uniref:uncharacterized protein n=1 Tax=Suillus paluster TaxID=48578 RepID=UPI001B87C434|nr:uncharacterized protein EDB91DRAFT_1243592 [Suillus paluster]KAG1751318.1 hypothetical protein EDB91DRAFT_1243592 [Suillus paluster]